ncbi:MAG: hypothetical protein K8W52_29975 [Deltaproteobacteria bacterium]|nr:hypothetical protein [Deltaproteobacteria bacterium]
MRFPILCSVLAASTCLAGCVDAMPEDALGTETEAVTALEQFGYKRMAALGTRPTYVMKVDYAGLPAMTESMADATRLVFGRTSDPSVPSVAGFYREMSNGRFELSHRATEQLSNYTPNASRDVFSDQIKRDLLALHPEIAGLDTNGDGKVTREEILIIALDNQGVWGGTSSDTCVSIAASSVQLCAPVANAGIQASLATIAHEGIHALSGNHAFDDLYGANYGKHNSGLTLMGPTSGTAYDRVSLMHLDPYAKLALGWIEPTVVSLGSGGASWVMPPQKTSIYPEAVLLWDPTRGPHEYFLAEYRRNTPDSYDRGTASDGLGLWHVGLDPSTAFNATGAPRRNGEVPPGGAITITLNTIGGKRLAVDLTGDPEVSMALFANASTTASCTTGGLLRAKSCAYVPTANGTVRIVLNNSRPTAAFYNLRVVGIGEDAYVYAIDPPWGGYGGSTYWPAGAQTTDLRWLDGSEAGARLSLSPPDVTGGATISWTRTLPSTPLAPHGTTALSDNMSGQSTVDTGSRLEVFERDASAGTLRHRYYDAAAGHWTAWEPIGTEAITSAPTALMIGSRLTVFARRDDGALWHQFYENGAWSGWRTLGGSITSAPTAVMWAGQPHVFVRGYDGVLWMIAYDGVQQRWSSWVRVGSPVLGSAPSAAVYGGELHVFATNTAGGLIRTKTTAPFSAWADWVTPGVSLSSAPSAVVAGTRLVVFGRDPAGALGHIYYENGWTTWLAITGGTIDTSPSATVTAQGRLVVFAKVGGEVEQTYWSNGWLTWTPLI